jgi:putative transposase
MRNISISVGEFYHVFNRGNNKQLVFLDHKDWIRFLFLIIYLQSPIVFQNLGRQVSYFVKNRAFNISEENKKETIEKRYVKLISFALMPNHFHLLVHEFEEGGIAQYMQRVLCAYTKYFNTKYKKSGHLFQGPYKAVHVKNNKQLLYLSAYIHKNPRELPLWKNKENLYPWSSYQDYVKENRWDQLLEQEIIIGQFSNKKEYGDFIKSSPAKEIKENLEQESLSLN